MSIWFSVAVFGKLVFTAGPLDPMHCQWMLDHYVPPVLDVPVIVDGHILKPEDYVPWCIVSPMMPPLGEFDRGQPT